MHTAASITIIHPTGLLAVRIGAVLVTDGIKNMVNRQAMAITIDTMLPVERTLDTLDTVAGAPLLSVAFFRLYFLSFNISFAFHVI